MNLIEQLGGYDEARKCATVLSEKLTEKQKNNVVFMDAFNALNDELLEHRRANNIFEVGDLVTHSIFWGLFEVIKTEKHHVLGVMPTGYETRLSTQLVRHATPQEIEAGYRS